MNANSKLLDEIKAKTKLSFIQSNLLKTAKNINKEFPFNSKNQ